MMRAWHGLANRLAGRVRLALIVPLAMAMAATAADTVPQVILATPGSSGTGARALPAPTPRTMN